MTVREEERNDAPIPAGDYFVVETRTGTWYVSTVMARHIEGALRADPPPGWIAFVDTVGSRVLLRADRIESVAQCTADQRAEARGFYRALREESRDGKSWDDCS